MLEDLPMGSLWQDLRYGARILARAPGFTAIVVLTLALAFVANGVIFSLVDAILLRPLPVQDAQQLLKISTRLNSANGSSAEEDSSYPDFMDVQKQASSLSGLAFYERRGAVLVGENDRTLLAANIVSGNYFTLLGVKPANGRFFTEEDVSETNPQRLVVISYSLWKTRFGGDPKISGKEIRLASGIFTIAAVTPREFRGMDLWFAPDIWMPMSVFPGASDETGDRGTRSLEMVGYVRAGRGLKEAQSELNTIGGQLAAAYPKTNRGRTFSVQTEIKSRRNSNTTLFGGVLFAVGGMILLIATANVGGLLLVRAERRYKEIAVRSALGAGRMRLIQQALTEGMLLSLLAAVTASLVAIWIIQLLPNMMPNVGIPLGFDFRFDGRVMGFTIAVSLLAVLFFGLIPAMRSSKANLTQDLNERSGLVSRRIGGISVRDIVAAGQVGVSLVLLVVAGLLVRTTWKAQSMDPGFNAKQNLLLLNISPNMWGYNPEKTRQIYSQIIDRIETLPGVQAASLVQRVPLSPNGGGATKSIFISGMELPPTQNGIAIHYTTTAPNYFQTMGTRILRGRAFTDKDILNGPGVVIVNESFARAYWPDRDAIGQHMLVGGRQGRDCEIVGIAQDGKYNDVTEAPSPYIFLPISQVMTFDVTLLVKTAGDPSPSISAVRQELRAIDTNISAISVMTLAEHMRFALYSQRMAAGLVGVLGLLGLFLATVGLYGVMSYSMNRRIHEFGVRLALGAERNDILKLVMGRGLLLALVGVAIGLIAAFSATRLLTGLLYGVSATDPFTFAGVTLLLVIVLLMASLIPARRATQVDPVVALRCE